MASQEKNGPKFITTYSANFGIVIVRKWNEKTAVSEWECERVCTRCSHYNQCTSIQIQKETPKMDLRGTRKQIQSELKENFADKNIEVKDKTVVIFKKMVQ